MTEPSTLETTHNGHRWVVTYTATGRITPATRMNPGEGLEVEPVEVFRDDEEWEGDLPDDVEWAMFQHAEDEYYRNRR